MFIIKTKSIVFVFNPKKKFLIFPCPSVLSVDNYQCLNPFQKTIAIHGIHGKLGRETQSKYFFIVKIKFLDSVFTLKVLLLIFLAFSVSSVFSVDRFLIFFFFQ